MCDCRIATDSAPPYSGSAGADSGQHSRHSSDRPDLYAAFGCVGPKDLPERAAASPGQRGQFSGNLPFTWIGGGCSVPQDVEDATRHMTLPPLCEFRQFREEKIAELGGMTDTVPPKLEEFWNQPTNDQGGTRAKLHAPRLRGLLGGCGNGRIGLD